MNKTIKFLKEYGVMVIGTIIYAAGIALFLDPNHLAPGGVYSDRNRYSYFCI